MRCQSNTNNRCSLCSEGYFQDGNSCGTTCLENPTFYLSDYFFKCVFECDSTLYSVDDQKRCVSSCPIEYFKLVSKCYRICPDSFYGHEASKQCLNCSPECATCTGPTRNECPSCMSRYYKVDTTCTLFCPIEYFRDNVNRFCVLDCDIG